MNAPRGGTRATGAANGVKIMSKPTLTEVASKYGAPMGRPSRGGGTVDAITFDLQRVPLNSGGYDSGGAYWGIGSPLYWASADGIDRYFRARDIVQAQAMVRAEFPAATFDTSNLDDFLAGYVACALWSSNDDSDESGGEPLDTKYDQTDIHADTLERMRADCAAFIDQCGHLITEENYTRRNQDGCGVLERAGHDFWLTRNGHGSGFWDGDWSEPAAGELSEAARKAGNRDLYIGADKQVHQG